MIKANLIKAVAKKTGFSERETEVVLNAVLDTITDTLASGEAVHIAPFGQFTVKHRAARSGTNPKTQAPIEVPAKNVAVFAAGAALKRAVNGE